jgi:hypothetical protein
MNQNLKAVVKYDLFPYILVHNVEKILDNGKVTTDVGTFRRDSVIALVTEKTGDRIDELILEYRGEFEKVKKEFYDKKLRVLSDIVGAKIK